MSTTASAWPCEHFHPLLDDSRRWMCEECIKRYFGAVEPKIIRIFGDLLQRPPSRGDGDGQ